MIIGQIEKIIAHNGPSGDHNAWNIPVTHPAKPIRAQGIGELFQIGQL